jgi:hypothetical protein
MCKLGGFHWLELTSFILVDGLVSYALLLKLMFTHIFIYTYLDSQLYSNEYHIYKCNFQEDFGKPPLLF